MRWILALLLLAVLTATAGAYGNSCACGGYTVQEERRAWEPNMPI